MAPLLSCKIISFAYGNKLFMIMAMMISLMMILAMMILAMMMLILMMIIIGNDDIGDVLMILMMIMQC
jgi:hypothetical protein